MAYHGVPLLLGIQTYPAMLQGFIEKRSGAAIAQRFYSFCGLLSGPLGNVSDAKAGAHDGRLDNRSGSSVRFENGILIVYRLWVGPIEKHGNKHNYGVPALSIIVTPSDINFHHNQGPDESKAFKARP